MRTKHQEARKHPRPPCPAQCDPLLAVDDGAGNRVCGKCGRVLRPKKRPR